MPTQRHEQETNVPRQCRETIDMSAVEITCSTTRCSMSQQQAGSHVVSVRNKRAGTLYEFEACVSPLNDKFLIDDCGIAIVFGRGGRKEIVPYTPFAGRPTERTAKLAPKAHEAPGWDIMQTVVDFYDSKQRQPNGSFAPLTKESDMIEYEVEVV
jgi:hypothetical protein